VARVSAHFTAPAYQALPEKDVQFEIAKRDDKAFAAWAAHNVRAHKVPGYAAVTLSLKAPGRAPGDASSEQMLQAADLADRFGFGELRVSQAQNLIIPDVKLSDLYLLWAQAGGVGMTTPTVGLLTDITCCPGGDFCDLANARSIPVANSIQEKFAQLEDVEALGSLKLNISGCMNACGHHHVGHIGILGVDKNDQEFYQITLGGAWGMEASLGKVIGPSVRAADVAGVVSRVVDVFRERRQDGERFIDTYRRIGVEEFKARAYQGVNTVATQEPTHD
jgi:sulfite reductase (NADPH) hemoprotein beta-component